MQSSYDQIAETQKSSEKQLKVAAMWWAQFLPGIKRVSFDEINKNSNIEGRNAVVMRTLHEHRFKKIMPVTDEQYDNFVNVLVKKIQTMKVNKDFDGLSYILKVDTFYIYKLISQHIMRHF